MDLMILDPDVEEALYKPLGVDEIRLLLLEPGVSGSPISARLQSANIASLPEYDGVSYVWGDPTHVVPICCDGISTNITFNLDWALRRVRHPARQRLLWVDALCINQNDAQERSEQVAMMGLIYAGARLVLACFGNAPDGGAANVASLLNYYGPLLAQPNGPAQAAEIWRTAGQPAETDIRWRSLGILMRAAWFRRAWVLQEVGLAKNPRVLYGEAEFSYRALIATVKWVRDQAGTFAVRAGISVLLIHTQWVDWSANWHNDPVSRLCSFLDLLDHAALLECSNPRDHIYAFLGHPSARAGGELVPDYKKDKLQVFKEASVILIRDAGIRTLSSVEHSEASIEEAFPSWVVRWDVSFILNNINIHPSDRYQASRGIVSYPPEIAGDILQFRGVVVDVVEAVFLIQVIHPSHKIAFFSILDRVHGTLVDLVQYLERPTTPYVYQTARAQSLAYTLSGEPWNGEGSDRFAPAWQEYFRWSRLGSGPNIPPGAYWYWLSMTPSSQSRAFIVTKRGYYGLAPHIARVGDLCSVAFGSAVPFILRSSQAKSNAHCRLVGESYIHGLMRGEAIEMVKSGRLHEQSITIS